MYEKLHAHADETLDAVNRDIRHILHEADDDGLDDIDRDALLECWRIKKDLAKALHAGHEHKMHHAHGAGSMAAKMAQG